jgi:large subunit ribosomal protein L3
MAKFSNKGLIVRKIGMTRTVDADGAMIPITLLKVEDQEVTKILDLQRDGYNGYQVGYFAKNEKNLSKADISRLRKVKVESNYSRFKEFRCSPEEGVVHEVGAKVTAELLQGISFLDVTGLSKGRGFQGAVKRWNSAIGPKGHGSRFHRRPGSLGQNSSPARVFKNKHQPGHLGTETVTIKNIKVFEVDVAQNVIAVKGSVPGHREGYLANAAKKEVIEHEMGRHKH